jgi:hypothetical protein
VRVLEGRFQHARFSGILAREETRLFCSSF